jgi:hypothetical protein
MASFNKGGQRRTIQGPCGVVIVGHPTEVNPKFERHRRHCSICKELNAGRGFTKLPEYSKEQGMQNGWKGVTRSNEIVRELESTTYVNGERADVKIKSDKGIHTASAGDKIKEELEKEALKDYLYDLYHKAPLHSDKYSGCEIGAMSIQKIKILIKLAEKELADMGIKF